MALLANRTVGRREALGLVAISLGFLMITLDATIVNVALGPIGSDLGGALSTAQWIVNGYTLAFAALLLSAGALADRLGSRIGFLFGLAVFGLGSAACACASSLIALIVARVIQGHGGGCADALLAGADRPYLSRLPRPSSCAWPVGWGIGNRPGRRTRPRRHPHCRLWLARDLLGQPADRRCRRRGSAPSRRRNASAPA